jgi:hypothetical protein
MPPAEWAQLVKSVTNPTVAEAVHHITRGPGFVLFDNLFPKADIDEANRIVDEHAHKELKRELAKVSARDGCACAHVCVCSPSLMGAGCGSSSKIPYPCCFLCKESLPERPTT